MRTIYIDSENKCHPVNDGTMTEAKTDILDGACDAVVEGYCAELDANGNIKKIYPFKDLAELNDAQREYEQKLLRNSIPVDDLQAAYREGVSSS